MELLLNVLEVIHQEYVRFIKIIILHNIQKLSLACLLRVQNRNIFPVHDFARPSYESCMFAWNLDGVSLLLELFFFSLLQNQINTKYSRQKAGLNPHMAYTHGGTKIHILQLCMVGLEPGYSRAQGLRFFSLLQIQYKLYRYNAQPTINVESNSYKA